MYLSTILTTLYCNTRVNLFVSSLRLCRENKLDHNVILFYCYFLVKICLQTTRRYFTTTYEIKSKLKQKEFKKE